MTSSGESVQWASLVLSVLLATAFVAVLCVSTHLDEPALVAASQVNAAPEALPPTVPVVEGNISIGPAGTSPDALAVDDGASEIFVGLDPYYVDVVSSTTNQILATINLGASGAPLAIAFDNVTQEAYVSTWADQVVVISAANLTIDARIAVGDDPSGIAYDPVDGDVYVTNFESGGIDVINQSTHEVTSSFSYLPFPGAIAYNPDTNQLVVSGLYGVEPFGYVTSFFPSNHTSAWTWVPSARDDLGPFRIACDVAADTVDLTWIPDSGLPSVLVLDGYNGSQIASFTVGSSATQSVWGITYDSSDRLVFVTDPSSNTLVGISTTTFAIVTTIPMGAYPHETVYDPANGAVYVTNLDSQSLTVVDAASLRVLENVSLAASPMAVAYDGPDGFVFAVGADHLYELSAQNRTVVNSVPVGLQPQGVAYDTRTRDVFVTNSADSTVSVLSVESLNSVATIAVGSTPIGVTYDNSTNTVYVACWGANEVDAISGESLSVVRTARVGLTPSAIAIDETDQELFVTNLNNDSVSIVSMSNLTVLGTINLPFGSSPVELAYDGEANEVFVSGRDSGNVSVISASSQSVIATVAVGGAPFGIAYVPNEDQILVSNYDGSDVTVVNASARQVIGTLSAGLSPIAIAYDSATGSAYAANLGSGNLSILQYPPPAYSVDFSETGLASRFPVVSNAERSSRVRCGPFAHRLFQAKRNVLLFGDSGPGLYHDVPRKRRRQGEHHHARSLRTVHLCRNLPRDRVATGNELVRQHER